MATFQRPTNLIRSRNQFSNREVGLTHPDNDSYIKITDNGSIELVVGDGLGIIIEAGSRSITIFGDNVKFMTKDVHGLRWNKLSFNAQSTKFTEPTFDEVRLEDVRGIFDGVEEILGND